MSKKRYLPHEKECLAYIRQAGLLVLNRRRCGSGHLKVLIESTAGTRAHLVLAKTPSDHRATKNFEARVDRYARGQFEQYHTRTFL